MALPVISQKQARITISGLTKIFWTSIKGGELTQEEVVYNDGNLGIEQTYTGFTKIGKLTLSKPFDPVGDKALQTFIKEQATKKTTFNITVTMVESDVAGTPLSGASDITYNNCIFLGYVPPNFDRDGTGLAKCELMVACNSMPTY